MLVLREDSQKIVTESQIRRMAELLLSSEDFYDEDIKILRFVIDDNGSMSGDFKDLDNNRVFEFAIDGQDVGYKPRIRGRRDSANWSDSRLLFQWEVESKVYLKQFSESRFDARKKRGKVKKKPKCTGISYNCGKRCLGIDLSCRISKRNNRSKQRLENLRQLAKDYKAGKVGPFYAGSEAKAKEVEAMRKAAYEEFVKRREAAREKRQSRKSDRFSEKLSRTAKKGKDAVDKRKSKEFQEPPSVANATGKVEQAKANATDILNKLANASPAENAGKSVKNSTKTENIEKGKQAVKEWKKSKKKDLTKNGMYQEPPQSTGAIAKKTNIPDYVAEIKPLGNNSRDGEFKKRPFHIADDPRYTMAVTQKELDRLSVNRDDLKDGLYGGKFYKLKKDRTLGGKFMQGNSFESESNKKLLFDSIDSKDKAISELQKQVDSSIKKKTGKSLDKNSNSSEYWRYVAQIATDEQVKKFDDDRIEIAKEANPVILQSAFKINHPDKSIPSEIEFSVSEQTYYERTLQKDRNLPKSLKEDLKNKALKSQGASVKERDIENRLTNKVKTSEKLEKLAENRINRSEEQLEEIADRKQNTARRSGMADYAKNRTIKTKTNAETLSKLAAANKKGQLSSGLKNVSQLKQLKVIENIDANFDDNFTSTYSSMEQVFDDPKQKQVLNKLGIEDSDDLIVAIKEYRQHKKDAPAISKVEQVERELIGNRNVGIDYFPTPPKVANRMVEKADIRPGMTVLEPSAGNGAIADAVRQSTPSARITTNEISSQLGDILEAKGYSNTQKDFLAMPTDQKYDRIVMNPPFGKGAQGNDQLHIRHAYDMLSPNGRLVAVASEGSFSRSDRNARDFQRWVESVGGEVEKVEPGAFKSSINPTGTATRIVTINKGDRLDSENYGKILVAAYRRQKARSLSQ